MFALVLAFASVVEIRAQPPLAPRLEFEVATLRQSPPSTGDLININLGTVRNGKVTLANATLSECVRFAYGIASEAQISGPDWIKSRSVRFDIVAQAPADGGAREPSGPSIFAALQEQLGLKLEPRKGALDVLAIDHAEKIPVEN